jgi:hypothetical protein
MMTKGNVKNKGARFGEIPIIRRDYLHFPGSFFEQFLSSIVKLEARNPWLILPYRRWARNRNLKKIDGPFAISDSIF